MHVFDRAAFGDEPGAAELQIKILDVQGKDLSGTDGGAFRADRGGDFA
ncbi:hypothetical protein [Nonomuraea basaltis]|nr:hypothetical protein [Nonomuraea basaltis]